MSYAVFTHLANQFLYPIRDQWEEFVDESGFLSPSELLNTHNELEEMHEALRNNEYNQFVRDMNIWQYNFYEWIRSAQSTAETIIDELESALEEAETRQEMRRIQSNIDRSRYFQQFFVDFEEQVDELEQDYTERVAASREQFDRQWAELQAAIDQGLPLAYILREEWTEGDYEAGATDFQEIDSWTIFDEKDEDPIDQAIKYLETEGVIYAEPEGEWYEQETYQDPYMRYLLEDRTTIFLHNFDDDELFYIRQQVLPTWKEEKAARLAEEEAERRRIEAARAWMLEAEEELYKENQ